MCKQKEAFLALAGRMFHLLFGIIAGLGLFSPTQALADCHKLETIFNPGDWAVSVQVEGRESKFYQEGHVNNSYRILYTAPEKVKITLMVEYVGSLKFTVASNMSRGS
jgi:hypothetical protein